MSNKLTRLLLVSGLVIGSIAAIITNQKVFGNAVQTKQAQTNTANIVEDNNFRFKFNSCLRSGTTVSCSILITNLEEDRGVALWGKAQSNRRIPPRIIDSEGNEYIPKKVDLGSNSASYYGERALTKLIQGIPTKAIFYYEISQNISKLAILEVNYYLESEISENKSAYKAEFRDISITTGTNTSTPQRKK